MRLLLVEDDRDLAQSLIRAFERDGIHADVVGSGTAALEKAGSNGYDVMILDLGLPDMDGLEVCRRTREVNASLPILMLTGRAAELDAVVGLDEGADDYLTKPVRLAELQARIRALLRRHAATRRDVSKGLRIDASSRRVFLHGRELDLTRKEFDLLALLAAEQGAVVTRERIMEEVWDTHWHGATKTLDMHVSSLRHKLNDDASNPKLLTTVRGVGYRLEEPSD